MARLALLVCVAGLFAKVQAVTSISDACTGYLTARYDWGCGDKPEPACLCKSTTYITTAKTCVDNLASQYSWTNESVAINGCKIEPESPDSLGEYEPSTTSLGSYKLPMPVRAFNVSLSDATAAYLSLQKADKSMQRSLLYGKVVVAYWIGIIVLKSLFYWLSAFCPRVLDGLVTRKIRQHLTMSALFRSRHCNTPSIGGFTLNIPTRLDSVIILLFTVLNAVLMFVDLGYSSGPNYLYEDDLARQYSRLIGMRSGYLCMYMLPVLFLFGGRNNLAIWVTGWPLDTFNVFHKWLGRITFVNLLIHAAGYTVKMLRSNRYIAAWKVVPWDWATLGFVCCGVMVFAAMHCFRRMSYEFFLWFHIFCAIWFVVGGYLHLLHLNESLGWYWAVIAIWGFDHVVRALRICISGVRAHAVIRCHEDIVELTVSYSGNWKPYAGSYAFIHILTPTLFWQSHPFSINESLCEEGKIKLYCRVKKGITRRVHNMCEKAGGTFDVPVWIDGPYGAHPNLDLFNEFLLIAGGIGITACFGQAVSLASKGHRNISLHWTMSDAAPLEWFREEIDYMLNHGIKLHLYVRGAIDTLPSTDYIKEKESGIIISTRSVSSAESFGPTFVNSRMDAYGVVSKSIAESYGPLAVLCCGPGGLSDQCRKSICDNLDNSEHYVQYFEESFSW